MFDISKIYIWKVMMSWHLKALGFKVYLAITKKSYLSNSMSSVNILSMYMTSDRVIAEHNQVDLSKLEARIANIV